MGLPSSPGVYIFVDANNTPLYIGKSIDLKSRLSQHFQNARNPDNKAAHFIAKTKKLILQTVESDLMAIILEANLIKTYQPYYNSAVKDDKTGNYIVIGDPPGYQISILHRSDLNLRNYKNPQTQIYGPYPDKAIANTVLKQVRHIFGYCQNPSNSSNHACFYFHIDQCPGPCVGQITAFEYGKHLKNIKIFLSGRFQNLMKNITKEIKAASKRQQYEQANKLKTQLGALEASLNSHQYSKLLILPSATDKVLKQAILLLKHPKLKAPPKRIECYDMATLNQENTVGVMIVFTDGKPDQDQYRKFIVRSSSKPGDPAAMKHIMARRLHHDEWGKPDLIILDGGMPQLSIVSQIIPPDIPVIALSKKRETIHFFNTEHQIVNLNLPLHNSVLKLFQFARDEAHRFATTFHKLRRQKTTLPSRVILNP